MKELNVRLEEIARLEGRIIVFSEKVRPEDYEDMGTFKEIPMNTPSAYDDEE